MINKADFTLLYFTYSLKDPHCVDEWKTEQPFRDTFVFGWWNHEELANQYSLLLNTGIHPRDPL